MYVDDLLKSQDGTRLVVCMGGRIVQKLVFRRWNGSGDRFGTIHGMIVLDPGMPLKCCSMPFDGDDPSDAGDAAEKELMKYLRGLQ